MLLKRLTPFIVVLFIVCAGKLQGQSLYVNEKDGTQSSYSLESIAKIRFVPGKLIVSQKNSIEIVYTFSTLQYLSFRDFSSGLIREGVDSNLFVNLYPNPVFSKLILDFYDQIISKGSIQFYDLKGQMQYSQKIADVNTVRINIDFLSPGIYICLLTYNSQSRAFKIIKH